MLHTYVDNYVYDKCNTNIIKQLQPQKQLSAAAASVTEEAAAAEAAVAAVAVASAGRIHRDEPFSIWKKVFLLF